MRYYHITKKENAMSIAFRGIQANDEGDIYIFTAYEIETQNKRSRVFVSDCIAMNQLGLDEYAIVEINPKGIKVELIPDKVAEITAPFQKIVKQNHIAKSYCKVVGCRKTDSESVIKFTQALFT